MFSVVFEVLPAEGQREAYLGLGKMLRPELEGIDGFVENIRYASLTREGWVLSVSHWRDEKAVVRWRTHARHHQAQDNGRTRILADYHLRVGEITEDTRLPEGYTLEAQRLDETVAGEGTTLTLITMKRPDAFKETSNPADCAQVMGLDPRADGILEWDVFDAVLEPGNLILADLMARQGSGHQIRKRVHGARCRPAPAGPRHPGLRHVRPARGPAVLCRCQRSGNATQTNSATSPLREQRAGIRCGPRRRDARR